MPEVCPFDDTYTWSNELKGGKYVFNGFTDSKLFYNSGISRWFIELLSNPNAHANTNIPGNIYPFGNTSFQYEGCAQGHVGDNVPSFNACNDDEFNCDSGDCIHISARCDGSTDCSDMSDEQDCVLVRPGQGYLKESPPISTSALLPVHVDFNIISVMGINEVDSMLTLRFGLGLDWRDVRLNFLNLKENEKRNILTPKDKSSIWIPEVFFGNSVYLEMSVMDEYTSLKVKRMEPFEPVIAPIRYAYSACVLCYYKFYFTW